MDFYDFLISFVHNRCFSSFLHGGPNHCRNDEPEFVLEKLEQLPRCESSVYPSPLRSFVGDLPTGDPQVLDSKRPFTASVWILAEALGGAARGLDSQLEKNQHEKSLQSTYDIKHAHII